MNLFAISGLLYVVDFGDFLAGWGCWFLNVLVWLAWRAVSVVLFCALRLFCGFRVCGFGCLGVWFLVCGYADSVWLVWLVCDARWVLVWGFMLGFGFPVWGLVFVWCGFGWFWVVGVCVVWWYGLLIDYGLI